MRPVGVIVDPPALDERFGFSQIIEDFPGQQLVSQFAVEALTVSHRQEKALPEPFLFCLCPRAARLNVQGLSA